MTSDIQDAISKLGEGCCIHVSLSNEDYAQLAGKPLTSHLLSKRRPLAYINVSRPSAKQQEALDEEAKKSVFFVDFASGSESVFSREERNILYLHSPEALSELGISLFSKDLFGGKKKIIVLDNLSELLKKNDERTVKCLLEFLRSRIEISGDCGLVISVENKGDDTAKKLASSFCKHTVRIMGKR